MYVVYGVPDLGDNAVHAPWLVPVLPEAGSSTRNEWLSLSSLSLSLILIVREILTLSVGNGDLPAVLITLPYRAILSRVTHASHAFSRV